MSHIAISYSRKPREDGIVSFRTVGIREKLLSRLLGKKRRMTIIVPGEDIDRVTIIENGGQCDEQDE